MTVRTIRTRVPDVRKQVVVIWVARVTWIVLPLSIGAAVQNATRDWSTATALTLAVLLYGAWLIATIALLAPRPWSFTLLRVVAPTAVAVALWAALDGDATFRWLAVAHAAVAAVVVLCAPVANAAAGAAAYGDERRYALRVPPAIGLLSLAVIAVVVGGVAAGPLLLAGHHWIAGTIALLIGWPLAAGGLRSLHSFERRFIVLVPNGLVLSDPLVIGDPVLLPRERIVAVRAAAAAALGEHTVDTRLGALVGGVLVQMDEPASFGLRRGRAPVRADALAFTPLQTTMVLRALAAHRLPVVTQRSTTPPPTTTSRA
jgi:hypothetical protein